MQFDAILHDVLIPNFCSKTNNSFIPSDIEATSVKVAEIDKADFARAWNAGLIKYVGSGNYMAAKGGTEGFFSSGPKAVTPRTFSLSVEPIITIGVLARLHFDFEWPAHLIGAQSVDWAFDAITQISDDSRDEYIACEVKKTRREIDTLLKLMHQYAALPELDILTLKDTEKNAYKKVTALRRRKAPIFWAVGPDRYEMAFSVEYTGNSAITFKPMPLKALSYSAVKFSD